MLNIPVFEAKRNLYVQMMTIRHSIEDQGFIEYLKRNITDEMDLYLHDLVDCLEYMFDFHFEFLPVPEEIFNDHAEGYNYFILGAIQIPSLLPYAKHPAFIEFTREIETIKQTSSANLVEMVYLPDSKLAVEDTEAYKEFASRPATFMFGMQDNGGMTLDDTISFLLELREINGFINLLVEGRESAA